jgi:hypothetical protein
LYFGSNAGSGSVITTVSGAISGAGSSLTWGTTPTAVSLLTSVVKDNNFLTLALSSTSNSYTGATVLGSTANVNGGVNGGIGVGTLLLGASEVIPNGSHIVFNGGSLNTGGNTENVGSLSLLQDGGTLSLGSGGHVLSFTGLGTLDYKTLTISGWQGTAGSSGTAGVLRVGSSSFFTRVQSDQFKFTYNSGTYSSKQLSDGELVPDVNTVSNRSNIRITTGTTTNGSWSPALGNYNTTYTFTPNQNNATISVADLVAILKDYYSNAIINTTYTGATQSGQVDFATALTTWNQNGSGYNRTLTVNGGGDVNISNAISFGYPGAYGGAMPANALSITTAGNINVTAPISTLGGLLYSYNSPQPDGGAVTLNSTAGSVSVSQQITTSGAVSSGGAAYGGAAGAISITGAGGVSISAPLVAVGKTGSYGDITISDGNATVTSAGVNNGVSSVITGKNFDQIHHLHPFRSIVDECFQILGFEQLTATADYSTEDFDAIKSILHCIFVKPIKYIST